MKTYRRCSMPSFWVLAKLRTLGRLLIRRRVRTRDRPKPNSTSISNRASTITMANTRLSRCREEDNTTNILNIFRNTIRTSSRIHSPLSTRQCIQRRNKISCSTNLIKFNSPKWRIPWKVRIRRWKRCWKHNRSQRVKIFILGEIEIALARQGESNRDLDRHIRCLKRIF